ncbi:hypothetical protein BDV95DRAFT_605761 [Massariosphaeria phaeospora]|uniref:Uncharacterized protein n=1 Tax=Massariosphaeria phaeospora TaxID=100035 RepID=A0A7C8MRG3_9PLEO|nr:hypothetical protein BDV95DRAFT_605761 [Massariosphaeria phaeospora]
MVFPIIVAIGAGVVACLAAVLVKICFFVIAKLGFLASGVAANSFAAWLHAQLGIVAAGSCFAFLQSAGAGGAAAGIIKGVITKLVAYLVGGLGAWVAGSAAWAGYGA